MNKSHLLQTYREVFLESSRRARRIVDPLTAEQFNWKPAATSWSVAECLDHLNRVARRYIPALEETVAGARRSDSETVHYGFLSRKFIASLTPGSKPVSTLGAMKPASVDGRWAHLDKVETLHEFIALTDAYVSVVEKSVQIDIAATKLRSPFLWILRLPVGAFLEALGQHALRHVNQAERVTALEHFPISEV